MVNRACRSDAILVWLKHGNQLQVQAAAASWLPDKFDYSRQSISVEIKQAVLCWQQSPEK
jgi:hypothetical protein